MCQATAGAARMAHAPGLVLSANAYTSVHHPFRWRLGVYLGRHMAPRLEYRQAGVVQL